MPLLNIAKTDAQPLYIDPSDVTAIHVWPEKGEMELFNSKGRLLFIGLESWNVDVADVVKKLADNGTQLVSLPSRHRKDKGGFEEYPQYIAPSAVTFATITEKGKDGKIGVIVGVKGVGREESYGTTPAEFDALLKAVRAVKPMLEYAPEEAHARWYNPAALYIDPKSVTQVRDSGFTRQIDVIFEQSGSLDIQIKEGTDVNIIANKIYDHKDETSDLQTIFREAHRRKDDEEKQSRIKFASDLAAANGTLINISSADRAVHIRREDIGYLSFHEERDGKFVLTINVPEGATRQDHINLYFETAAEREKTVKTLNAALSKPARKKQIVPKPGTYM